MPPPRHDLPGRGDHQRGGVVRHRRLAVEDDLVDLIELVDEGDVGAEVAGLAVAVVGAPLAVAGREIDASARRVGDLDDRGQQRLLGRIGGVVAIAAALHHHRAEHADAVLARQGGIAVEIDDSVVDQRRRRLHARQQILDVAVARVVGAHESDQLDRPVEGGEDLARVLGEHRVLLGRQIDPPAGACGEQLHEDQRDRAAERADRRRQPAALRGAHRCPRQWRASSTRSVRKEKKAATATK